MTEQLTVLLVGLDEPIADLLRGEGWAVHGEPEAGSIEAGVVVDAVVVRLGDASPLEAVRVVRERVPEAALVVVTSPEAEADATVALHAGAEDHVPDDAHLPAVLARAIRSSVRMRALERKLTTVDGVTSLPTLLGFAPIAEHHLRMADRDRRPVVFVFVRVEEHDAIARELGAGAVDELVFEVAEVIRRAVRAADLPARIGPDTFCVLLVDAAEGAETLVLSRLVEAIAEHDAGRGRPSPLSVALGTARYEPGSGATLAEIVATAERRLAAEPEGRTA